MSERIGNNFEYNKRDKQEVYRDLVLAVRTAINEKYNKDDNAVENSFTQGHQDSEFLEKILDIIKSSSFDIEPEHFQDFISEGDQIIKNIENEVKLYGGKVNIPATFHSFKKVIDLLKEYCDIKISNQHTDQSPALSNLEQGQGETISRLRDTSWRNQPNLDHQNWSDN